MSQPNLLPIPWNERDTRSVPDPDEVRILGRIAAQPRNFKSARPAAHQRSCGALGMGNARSSSCGMPPANHVKKRRASRRCTSARIHSAAGTPAG